MRNTFCLVLLLLFLTGAAQAQLQYPNPPPYTGTNPSNADIRAKLVAAGQRHHIPPHLLFGIAYVESGWAQYNPDGHTKYHWESDQHNIGLGIMQITVDFNSPDVQRLCTDIDYNIERGAQLLEDKWGSTPVIGDGVGMQGREKLENWYYAVWAYNGFVYGCAASTYCNDPRDVSRDKTYQGKVYDAIASGYNGQWQTIRLSEPTNYQIGPRNTKPQTIPTTPAPIHIDADFDGVIDGTPSTTDIYVDGNYNGTQTGTSSQPFKTITAAVNAADKTKAVVLHVVGMWYHEGVRIRQNLRIVRNGGSGPVRIRP